MCILGPDGITARIEEKRGSVDRRQHKFLPAIFSRHHRRQNTGRREEDTIGYVDFYDWKTWVVAISVLVLSLLDGIMTSTQIIAGRVQEANPLMRMAINRSGIYTFCCLKAAMTAVPMAILVLHKEWRLARITARICLAIYILIAFYHFVLVVLCGN
jgi:hypothetical protein